jgi:hypothetical protein
MQKSVELTAHRVDHGWRAVPCIEAANAAGKIDQPVAIHIFDYGSFGFRDEDRGGMEASTHHGRIAPLHQGLGARSGNWRS